MTDFALYLLMMGMMSSGSSVPFWATANQYGLYSDRGPYATLAMVGASSQFDESKTFQLRFGGSLASVLQPADAYLTGARGIPTGRAAVNVIPDEFYLSGRWKVLRLDLGIKHREREFLGGDGQLGSLSLSEGHIAESNNTRAMPGYEAVLEPLAIPFTGNRLSIAGSFGDYRTLDNRYVKGALVHRTKAYIRYDFSPRFYAQLGIDHYALWGGYSPEHGQMPVTFDNYLRVVTGRCADTSGSRMDQMNVIGDQGGAEQLRLGWKGERSTVTFQYEKPYSDKSGMTFQNLPDGLYTLHWARADRHSWISDVLLEWMYTMYQSGTIHDNETDERGVPIEWKRGSGLNFNGGDDYFVNSEYKSGWSHFGRSICAPLLTPDYRQRQNTRVKAWHLGLAGEWFREVPYRLMLTYSINYGTYWAPFVFVPGTEYGTAWNTGWKWWQKDVYDKGVGQLSAALTGHSPLVRNMGRHSADLSLLYGFYADFGKYLELRTGVPVLFGATLGIRMDL